MLFLETPGIVPDLSIQNKNIHPYNTRSKNDLRLSFKQIQNLMGESTISLTGQSLSNNLSVALKKISSALHLKREFKKIVCSHSIDFVSFRNCPWMLFIMPIFPKYKTLMYQSVPSLSIPPGQYPRPIFLMGEFLTPRARKEFKTPPPGL